MDYLSSELAAKYLRSRKIPCTACSGCGLGVNHKIIVQAIEELGLEVKDVVWGTSIGCAGRQTFATWKGDGFAGTHGRVYAIARGLRLALPRRQKTHPHGGRRRCLRDRPEPSAPRGPLQRRHDRDRERQPGLPVHRRAVRLDNARGQQDRHQPLRHVRARLHGAGLGRHEHTEGRGCHLPGAAHRQGRPDGGGEHEEGHPEQGLLAGPYALPLPHQLRLDRTSAPETRSTIYRWIVERSAPLGQETADTLWATGVYHDASNSRPEFAEMMREKVEKIRRTGTL